MKPNRIFLIRHGSSEGNENIQVYQKKPDYALLLTETGKKQAKFCGQKIRNKVRSQYIAVYYSPFFRARQTKDIALECFDSNKIIINREEPRLREQEWSTELRKSLKNEKIQAERDAYGTFYYRFKGGESNADVYNRMSDFLDTLHRDFEKSSYPPNVLLFMHGMSMRIFLMRFLHATVEEFETWANPPNGGMFVLEKNVNQKYDLVTPLRKHQVRHIYQYPFK